MSRYQEHPPAEVERTPEELAQHQMKLNERFHASPPGYTHEPHNKRERHHEETIKHMHPDVEPYREATTGARSVGGAVYKEGPAHHEHPAPQQHPHGKTTYDQVVEGRLGGGEEVLYSGDKGPIGSSDPKPGGHPEHAR